MAQKSPPVRLERIMNGMPVPVHDAKCSCCQMAVCLQAELPVIRSPSRISLCFRLQHKVVIVFQGANQIPSKSDFSTCKCVLCRMINIHTGKCQVLRTFKMIYIRLHTIRIAMPFKIQIVSDKLIFSLIF